MTTKTQIIKAVFTPTLLYQSENWTVTSKERQMLTTTEMRCLRKAAGKTGMQASTLTAGPLARQIFSPSLASRASGSSSLLARKGQWPSVRTTRCLFCTGPKRKSDLRIKSKTMRKSDLSRRIHLFSVIRPTPFISGFPSLGHPSPDSGKQRWLYPALSDRRVCDRDRIMESLCFGSFREWHNVRAQVLPSS